jgi:cation:H+ antiporter
VLNLAFLVLMDLLHRTEPVWRRANRGHVLAAGFGIVLLGFLLLGLLLGQLAPQGRDASLARVGDMGLMTPIMLALYLIAMRTVFSYERDHPQPAGDSAQTDPPLAPPLRQAVLRFALAAGVVVAAGLWLPFAATQLADAMQWNRSFVGSLFVALATTLPELAVTVSALRIGALDMAIGNLLGSNLFNVTIVAVEDLFYRPGVLLAHVSLVHAATATSAIVMTGLAVVGLFFRPQGRVLRAVGAVSLGLVAVYLLNTYVIFLHGA